MSTSQTTGLSEPVGADKISVGTLGYIRARHRQRAYDLVIREFKKSGMTQADLARRLGKSPEVISRLLARPSNWEADTFSDLLFAISGAIASYRAEYPLSQRIQQIPDEQIKPESAPIRPKSASALGTQENSGFIEEWRKQARAADSIPIAA
jgi:transcriptional regulator with XRE-family HTH domain